MVCFNLSFDRQSFIRASMVVVVVQVDIDLIPSPASKRYSYPYTCIWKKNLYRLKPPSFVYLRYERRMCTSANKVHSSLSLSLSRVKRCVLSFSVAWQRAAATCNEHNFHGDLCLITERFIGSHSLTSFIFNPFCMNFQPPINRASAFIDS